MELTRLLRPRVSWCALLAALAFAALPGCGGDKKKKGSGTSDASAKSGKSKRPRKSKKPKKPKVPRSKSGKTARQLVDAIGGSYKEMDAGQSPADLANAEMKRVQLVAELIEIGPAAMKWVLDALGHPVGPVREWACVVLGAYGKSKAADALLAAALDDRDRNLGVYACDALGRIEGIAGAMERLKPRLSVQSYKKGHPLWDTQAGLLRNAAAAALTRAGSKEGVPVLIANLEGFGAEVRRDALVRLRRLTRQQIATTVDGPAAARKRTIEQWKAWWGSNKGLFRPTPREGHENHAVYAGKK